MSNFYKILFLLIIFISPSFSSDTEKYNTKLLNNKELDFIKNNKIRVCALPNIMPLSNIDKDGNVSGITNNFLKIISQKHGIELSFLKTKNIEDVEELLKNDKCDITPLFIKTKERLNYLSFTQDYFKIPYVLVTKDDKFYIDDFSKINNKNFVILKGFKLNNEIKQMFKKSSIKEVKTLKEAIQLIEQEKVFAFIAPYHIITYFIHNKNINHIKISGNSGYVANLRIAIKKDKKIINDIYTKILSSLKEKEKNYILSNWVEKLQIKEANEKMLIKTITYIIILFLIIIFLFTLYWNKKLQKINKKLQILSTTDELTSLLNRTKLNELFKREIELSTRHDEIFSIIILDIDNFKRINDNYGHLKGDKVLKEVSKTLKTNLRSIDYLGRWGGEEFLIICPHTNIGAASILAEKLRVKIENIQLDKNIKITCSFGIAQFEDKDKINTLTAKADKALLNAKADGKNCVKSYLDS